MLQHIPTRPETPQAALEALLDGNRRFVDNRCLHGSGTALSQEEREELARGQNPYAVIVGCSDSRTAPEIVFDEGLGRIFVVRVAGNVLDSLAIASIQYAVEHTGAHLVMILGHTACGAVTSVASAGREALPGELAVFQTLMPGLLADSPREPREEIEAWVERLADRNALLQCKRLGERCDPVRERVLEGACGLVAARHDLVTGRVDLVGDGLILGREI